MAHKKCKITISLTTLLIPVLFLLCGCAQDYFVRETSVISDIQRLAVLPFENYTGDPYADEKIRRIVITDLLSRGIDVVEPGEVTSILKELKIMHMSSITKSELQKIGEMLGVKAVMLGSVEAFGISQGINVRYPEVTINLMLIETNSGNIIWSVRRSTGGASFWTRHFGSEGISLSEAARKTVKETIDTLY